MTRTLNYHGLFPRAEAEKAARRIVALTNYRRNVPVALDDFADPAERHGLELLKQWGWAKPSGARAGGYYLIEEFWLRVEGRRIA